MNGEPYCQQPFCSILIPAYEYPEGISAILKGLEDINKNEFEIIISDDSKSDSILNLVESHALTQNGILKYYKNFTSLGAVNNWNHLIDLASSDIVVLLHHDEYFINSYDLQIAIKEILSGKVDIIVGQVKLLKKPNDRPLDHFPLFLSRFLMRKFPEYIYLRNYLGPVSCLIFRKSLCVYFDINLRWLVDVDFYYRLRLKTNKWLFLNSHIVYSLINRPASITAKIRGQLEAIKIDEYNYLRANRMVKLLSIHNWSLFLKLADNAIWYSFRLIWNSVRLILRWF